MKHIHLIIISIMLSACIPSADSHILYVGYVIDGDTFVTETGKTVRLWGIDAPEKDKPYYETSRLTLESLIEHEPLKCTLIGKGKYRRDLMRCYLGDSDIAAIMVKKGMAKNYDDFPNDYYLTEEIEAQQNELGIWKN